MILYNHMARKQEKDLQGQPLPNSPHYAYTRKGAVSTKGLSTIYAYGRAQQLQHRLLLFLVQMSQNLQMGI